MNTRDKVLVLLEDGTITDEKFVEIVNLLVENHNGDLPESEEIKELFSSELGEDFKWEDVNDTLFPVATMRYVCSTLNFKPESDETMDEPLSAFTNIWGPRISEAMSI